MSGFRGQFWSQFRGQNQKAVTLEDFLVRLPFAVFSLDFKRECGTDKIVFKALAKVAYSPCSFLAEGSERMRLLRHDTRSVSSSKSQQPLFDANNTNKRR
jgi:hypothetical protein